MRQSTPLLPVALAIAFAACRDAPTASIVDADLPVPRNPAIYAPDGWPLRIGDRVSDEDRDRLRKEFLSPYQWAIHVVGDQLQAARWDWPDEPHDYSRLVYAGHFPATMPWYARDEEQDLPQRFHGRIEYDPTPQYRMMLFGREQLVDEGMYLAWREWQGIVAGRRERTGVGR